MWYEPDFSSPLIFPFSRIDFCAGSDSCVSETSIWSFTANSTLGYSKCSRLSCDVNLSFTGFWTSHDLITVFTWEVSRSWMIFHETTHPTQGLCILLSGWMQDSFWTSNMSKHYSTAVGSKSWLCHPFMYYNCHTLCSNSPTPASSSAPYEHLHLRNIPGNSDVRKTEDPILTAEPDVNTWIKAASYPTKRSRLSTRFTGRNPPVACQFLKPPMPIGKAIEKECMSVI